jgi:hypothetical protein
MLSKSPGLKSALDRLSISPKVPGMQCLNILQVFPGRKEQ